MAYVPNSTSVVAFQTDATKLLVTATVNNGSVVAFQGNAPWANTNVGSVITASQGSIATVIIGGSIAASFTPPANQSVSGTVHVDNFSSVVAYQLAGSILATSATVNPAANQSVSGAVTAPAGSIMAVNATQGTTPWIIGSVYGNISGSVAATVTNTVTVVSSIAGGIFPVSGSVSAVITNFPTTQNVSGSVVATQGTTPWQVVSSLAGGIFPVSGSVSAVVTNFPTTQNVSGSVAAFQAGTNITSVSGNVTVVSSIAGGIFPISGSVAAVVTNTPNVNTAGSVVAFQGAGWSGSVAAVQIGTANTSVLSITPSSLLTGNYGQRNDTVSSFLGGNLTWNPLGTDSAGRVLTKPFASEDGTIISYVGSIVSGSVQLIQASVIGKRSYVTDFWISNTGATTTLVTIKGGDTSILGQFIAPTGGGMSSPGLAIPLKTTASQDLAFSVSPSTSVLYLSLKGYQSP